MEERGDIRTFHAESSETSQDRFCSGVAHIICQGLKATMHAPPLSWDFIRDLDDCKFLLAMSEISRASDGEYLLPDAVSVRVDATKINSDANEVAMLRRMLAAIGFPIEFVEKEHVSE
jgi:hypothetical protein